MAKQETALFEKKVYASGGSLALTIPTELLNFLEIDEGTEIRLGAYHGKHGRYIAIWKK